MATLGPESARTPLSQLGSSPSIQTHLVGPNLPPNRGLERALEEAAASGVLNLSSRKLKEFPRTAANHDLTDTVEAGKGHLSPLNDAVRVTTLSKTFQAAWMLTSVTVVLYLWRWHFRYPFITQRARLVIVLRLESKPRHRLLVFNIKLISLLYECNFAQLDLSITGDSGVVTLTPDDL